MSKNNPITSILMRQPQISLNYPTDTKYVSLYKWRLTIETK